MPATASTPAAIAPNATFRPTAPEAAAVPLAPGAEPEADMLPVLLPVALALLPVALPVAVPLADPELDGAAAAILATLAQVAAAFVLASPCLYGR
jgi:hypothetical protein